MMASDRSIRFRLIVLVVWIVVPIMALAVFGAVYAWQTGRRATERELVARVHMMAAGINRELEVSRAALLALATSPSLATGDFEAFQQQLQLIPKPDGARVVLTDTSGRTHVDSLPPYGASSPKPGDLGSVSQVFATNQSQVSDLHVEPATRDYLVAVNVPVELDGRVAYGLTMGFTPSVFTSLLDRQGVSDEWRAIIVDGNGLILAHSSNVGAFVGRRVSSTSHAAISRGEGVFTTTAQDGHPMLAANARVPGTGWSTVVATRLDLMEAALLRSLGATAAAGAIMLLLSLLSAAWYASRIARPMHALVGAADALAHGGQPRPTPPGVWEASRVGAALARTAATLRWREQERAQTEAALRESEARFRTITDAMPQMVWSARADGHHDYYNQRWYEYTGTSPGDADGEGWRKLFQPDDLARAIPAWRHSLATGQSYEVEYRLRRADGTWRWCLGRASPVRDATTGAILRWFGTCTDIQDLVEARETLARGREDLERLVAERTAALTQAVDALHAEAREREQAEEALRQAQKMEAVGQLTGGIAHDFNNMLQGISGSLELMRRRIEQGRMEEAAHFVESALKTVERAASLTNRLLAFARRQALRPTAVDPGALIIGMEELIRRTLQSAIAVELRVSDSTWPVLCDPNQLENVLLNLAINAGDAMPDGGRLTVEARHVRLDQAAVAGQDGASPGDYVEIAVADTGTGMDEATLERAFEPFFTTKPIGRGTGLGLSQLYGFVRQSQGVVRIESAPGRGTTIRLGLPRYSGSRQVGEQPAPVVLRRG